MKFKTEKILERENRKEKERKRKGPRASPASRPSKRAAHLTYRSSEQPSPASPTLSLFSLTNRGPHLSAATSPSSTASRRARTHDPSARRSHDLHSVHLPYAPAPASMSYKYPLPHSSFRPTPCYTSPPGCRHRHPPSPPLP